MTLPTALYYTQKNNLLIPSYNLMWPQGTLSPYPASSRRESEQSEQVKVPLISPPAKGER